MDLLSQLIFQITHTYLRLFINSLPGTGVCVELGLIQQNANGNLESAHRKLLQKPLNLPVASQYLTSVVGCFGGAFDTVPFRFSPYGLHLYLDTTILMDQRDAFVF